MVDQSARQRARRVALDAQARMRARRVEQERRRDALGLAVVTALAERDSLVSTCEARAGAALVTLTGQEGLSLADAVEWCGGSDVLSVREAARLRAVGQAADDERATTNGSAATSSGAGTTDAGGSATSSDRGTTTAQREGAPSTGVPTTSSAPADEGPSSAGGVEPQRTVGDDAGRGLGVGGG